jgi:penicillin-binding protein 2
LIGRQGVEESYEEILRGIKVKYFQKDKYNREIGSYKDEMILLQYKEKT